MELKRLTGLVEQLEPKLLYGTKSGGQDYLYVVMNFVLAGDREGEAPAVTLTFQNVDTDVVKVLESIRTPARLTLALVDVDVPDVVIDLYTFMKLVRADCTDDTVSVDWSREYRGTRPCPSRRMTRDAAPSLFR